MGIFSFDLVAWAFGGSTAFLSRLVYIVVALAACWGVSMLFRRNVMAEEV
ncbi:MAG: DUF378 domain-containing protein [Lachnospiraceae bacterium]|nr:DUF378 domain-containing protein [Ruminococcus sp.]MCM1275671.1 DUF378 domain-containing protein [Lachnospiraceae bacterium]